MSKNIPTTKDVEPLLEIDGDVRSFEVFLSSRTPFLTARDIRTFLPCTVNLDPKLREIIAGEARVHNLLLPHTAVLTHLMGGSVCLSRCSCSPRADQHGWGHVPSRCPDRFSAPPHLCLQSGVLHLLTLRLLLWTL